MIKLSKKGSVGVDSITPFAIMLVVAGIVLGAGALVLSKFQEKLVTTSVNVSYYAVGNASDGLLQVASFLPTIGIIIAIVIIIGLVVSSLASGTRN